MEDAIEMSQCVYFEFNEFYREVRMLNIIELRPLGILPDTMIGMFYPSHLEELTEFCLENPSYHILSSMPGGIMINCPVSKAHHYFLCNGNPNPRLVCKSHMLDVWVPVAR